MHLCNLWFNRTFLNTLPEGQHQQWWRQLCRRSRWHFSSWIWHLSGSAAPWTPGWGFRKAALDDRSQTAAISRPKSRLSAQRRAAERRASWSRQQVSSESVCLSLCTGQQHNRHNKNKTRMGVKEVTLTVAVLNLTLQLQLQLQNKWLTNNRKQYSSVCQLLTQQQREHTLNKASYSSDTIPLNITKCRSFPWVRSGKVKSGPAPTSTKCNEMSTAAFFLCGSPTVTSAAAAASSDFWKSQLTRHVRPGSLVRSPPSCFLIGPQSAAVKWSQLKIIKAEVTRWPFIFLPPLWPNSSLITQWLKSRNSCLSKLL